MNTLTDGTVRFFKGLLNSLPWIRAWVAMLVWIMVGGPMLFWDHFEARVILATIMFAGLLMSWLTGRYGFVRLLGLGHLPFLPLWAYLFDKARDYPHGDAFGTYLWIVLGVITISLAFDIADVIRYIRGERAEMVVTN